MEAVTQHGPTPRTAESQPELGYMRWPIAPGLAAPLPQGCRRQPTDPLNTAAAPACRMLRQGGIVPEVFRHFVDSPCGPSAKPGILAACIAPHQYLSGAALSPPGCLHRTLRPNGSVPAADKHEAFPSLPSLRFVAHSAAFPTEVKNIVGSIAAVLTFWQPGKTLDRFQGILLETSCPVVGAAG
jgi:hypothetical protein